MNLKENGMSTVLVSDQNNIYNNKKNDESIVRLLLALYLITNL